MDDGDQIDAFLEQVRHVHAFYYCFAYSHCCTAGAATALRYQSNSACDIVFHIAICICIVIIQL